VQGEVLGGATECMLELATIAKRGLTVGSPVPASRLSVIVKVILFSCREVSCSAESDVKRICMLLSVLKLIDFKEAVEMTSSP
jgi:hypothetical protein